MIDAETTMNLEVDVEQVTKQEVHYEEKDLQNEEKVQKILQRYKNRITDLYIFPKPRHKIIHHQKRQNDNLKIELKVLNNQLNSVIDKIGHKSQAV